MGQYFYLINVDNSADIRGSVGGKFEVFFFYSMSSALEIMQALWCPEKGHRRVTTKPFPTGNRISIDSFSKKSVLVFPKEHVTVFIPRLSILTHPQPYRSPANITRSAFGQLATEIIDLIFGQLDDVEDVVYFAITCQSLYEIGRRHLEPRLEDAFIISWASNRLVCIGENTDTDDFPPGMLTDNEVQILEKDIPFDLDVDRYTELQLLRLQDMPDPSLNRMKLQYRREYSGLGGFWGLMAYGHSRPSRRFRHWTDMDTAALEELVCPPLELTHDMLYDGSYVLRNLTTKEYVRGEAVKNLPEQRWSERIGLDHVLMVRITWSSDGVRIVYDGPLKVHRGVWAGHRFDFSKTTTVQNEQGPIDGWKDVSDEVLAEVVALFKAQMKYV